MEKGCCELMLISRTVQIQGFFFFGEISAVERSTWRYHILKPAQEL